MAKVRKPDPAHIATDGIIDQISKDISKEYAQAHKEVSEKLRDYLRRYEIKDNTWRKWVAEGKRTKDEYRKWRHGQIMMGKRWQELKENLAEDYTNAHKIAQSIARGYMPEVYAVNHNYETYRIEHATGLDTSYTLYSREAVERMYRENPKLYHEPGRDTRRKIDAGEITAWNRKQIQSVMTQGILQGESIPDLSKRLERVTGSEHNACIRDARTMATGVQNAGRVDAMDRAKGMGIPVRKQWLATLDSRTRHWHRDLDGETAETDEPFIHSIPGDNRAEIMYPGDPDAQPCDIYNCRCTILEAIRGHEIDTSDISLRHDKNLEGMTYEEWKDAKAPVTSNPITEPGTRSEKIKQQYIDEYKAQEPPKEKYESDKLKTVMGKEYQDFAGLVDKAENRELYEKYIDNLQITITKNGGVAYGNRFEASYNKEEGVSKYATFAHEANHCFDVQIKANKYTHFTEIDTINAKTPIGSGFTKTLRARMSNSDEFLTALRKDAEALKPRLLDRTLRNELLADDASRNASAGIQDMIDGFYSTQSGKSKYGFFPWGHGDRYYNRMYNKRVSLFDNERGLKSAFQELGFDASSQAKCKRLMRTYDTASEAWANVGSAVTCGGKELEMVKKYMPETHKAYLEIIKGIE